MPNETTSNERKTIRKFVHYDMVFWRDACRLPDPDDVSLSGVCGVCGSRESWLRKIMIHGCCSSSAAVALLPGSRSKHARRKSIPWSLS